MTNYSVGHKAEQIASDYLKKSGYTVIDVNWQNRLCEIDIVAKNNNIIYFFEVKYRRKNTQGSGLEYITNKKLKQMSYAAEFWVLVNNWQGDFCLGAIEMSGSDFVVDNVLTDL